MRPLLFVAALVCFVSVGISGQGPDGGQRGPGQGQRPARAQVGRNTEDPRGTAILRGQVVAADTGAPIRRAQLRIFSSTARDGRIATTDAQGQFEVKELVAGRYTMTASKGGFVSLQYGQRRPSESGTPIELGDGETLDKLIIALPRGSVLGGRVTDEFGEPVANATVVALRYGYAGGARRLMPVGSASSRDNTDDQGQYRLFGLPPGEYYVSATLRTGGGEITDPMGGEPSGYAATYYPGVPNMGEAARVTLAVSQENTGVSFGLIATRLVAVSGQVIGSDGSPASGSVIMLLPGGGAVGRGMMQGGNSGRADQTGMFRLTNVAPGRYQAQARTGMRGDGELAKMDLIVGNEDVEGIVLVTAKGGRATGNVVSDTGEPLDFRPQQIQVAARAVDVGVQGIGGGGGGNARVNGDWTFELANLTDARLIRVNTPREWTLKSVFLGSEEITDLPMEFPAGQTVTGLQVVLTKQIGTLSGVVTDERGNPVLDATVVVFPANEELWMYQSRFIKAARPDQEGLYRLTALPPGEDYLVIALQGLEDGQAGDAEFLATVRDQATAFSLGDGETKAVDVKLTTRP